jgi:hypothetical protein
MPTTTATSTGRKGTLWLMLVSLVYVLMYLTCRQQVRAQRGQASCARQLRMCKGAPFLPRSTPRPLLLQT